MIETMMICRALSRPQLQRQAHVLGRQQTRTQGTAAIARHANEQIATKTQYEPTHFNSTIHIRSPTVDFSSFALKRDEGDYYFEAHSEALFAALNSYLDKHETIRNPVAQHRVSAIARDMDLVEASYAARDHESYDKILILMRHGEAKHNVFEKEYARKHGTSMMDANADEEYPVDPMLTGKVCEFLVQLR
jgi:hypothetical protein